LSQGLEENVMWHEELSKALAETSLKKCEESRWRTI